MEIKYLEVLVMPNDEILCEGKTIGYVNKLGKYLVDADKVSKPKKEEEVSSKYKISQEYTSFLRKTKEYVLEVGEEEITIRKWWEEDEVGSNYDCDWECADDESKKKYDALDEDEQDELSDFINELN